MTHVCDDDFYDKNYKYVLNFALEHTFDYDESYTVVSKISNFLFADCIHILDCNHWNLHS